MPQLGSAIDMGTGHRLCALADDFRCPEKKKPATSQSRKKRMRIPMGRGSRGKRALFRSREDFRVPKGVGAQNGVFQRKKAEVANGAKLGAATPQIRSADASGGNWLPVGEISL